MVAAKLTWRARASMLPILVVLCLLTEVMSPSLALAANVHPLPPQTPAQTRANSSRLAVSPLRQLVPGASPWVSRLPGAVSAPAPAVVGESRLKASAPAMSAPDAVRRDAWSSIRFSEYATGAPSTLLPAGRAAEASAGALGAGQCAASPASLPMQLTPPAYAVSRGNTAGDVYTVTVTNNYTATITEVGFLIEPGAGFTYVGNSATFASSTVANNPLGYIFEPGTGNAFTLRLTGSAAQTSLAPGETLTGHFSLATNADAVSGQMLRVSLQSGSPVPLTCQQTQEDVSTVRGNLTVDKTPHVQSARFGDVVTWTVALRNTGLGMVYGATVQDVTGSGLTDLNTGQLPAPGGLNLAPNEEARYQISARINACTGLTNTVPSYWSIGNQDASATITKPVSALTDIKFILEEPSINVSFTAGVVPYCGSRTITATVVNAGGPARSFRLASNLIALGDRFDVVVNDPDWSYNPSDGVFSYNATGTPNPDTIDRQTTKNLVFTLQAKNLCSAVNGALSLQPQYTDACGVPFQLPSTAATLDYASTLPDIGLSEIVPDVVRAGQVFSYTVNLTATNLSGFTPVSIHVTDTLPANFSLLGVHAPTGTITPTGNTIAWEVPHPASGSLAASLTITVAVHTDQTCGAYFTASDAAQATAAVTCPTCGPLSATASRPIILENGPGAYGKTVSGSGEVCSDDPPQFGNHYHLTDVSWASTVFTDELGSKATHGIVEYEPNSLRVEINGLDYTDQISITQTSPELVLDFRNVQAPTNTVSLYITYTARLDEASLGGLPSLTFHDWSTLYAAGGAGSSACTGNHTYYQGASVTAQRGELGLAIDPASLNACEATPYELMLTGGTPGLVADHISLTTLLGASDRYSTTYTYGGALAGPPAGTVPSESGNRLSWAFADTFSLSGPGSVSLPITRRCNTNDPWSATVTFQDLCGVEHSASTQRTPTLLNPNLVLFVTPSEYLVTARTATYRIYVTNNGDGVAHSVVITDVLGSGLAFASATIYGASGAKTSWTGDGNDVSWLLDSLAPGGQAYLDVVVEIVGCSDLVSTVTTATGCSGSECSRSGPQQVRFVRPSVSMLTSNGQTASLPLCSVGTVLLTVKNTSSAANLYGFAITDTVSNLTYIAGSTRISVTTAAGQVLTAALPFEPVTTTVDPKTTTLVWNLEAAGGDPDRRSILLDRAAGDIIQVSYQVRTDCTSSASLHPGNQVAAQVTAQEACYAPLAATESAKTLRTLDPALSMVKQVRNETASPGGNVWSANVNANPGNVVVWRVQVSNAAGAQVVQNLVVTDTLPSNLGSISAGPSGYTQNGSTLVWGAAGGIALAPGQTRTYYITGTVASVGCADANVNTAQASFCCSGGLSCGFGAVTKSATLRTKPLIALSPANGSYDQCGGTPVSVSIANSGPPAPNFVFTYTLPSNVVYDGEATPGTVPSADIAPAPGDGGDLMWRWNQLPTGGATVRFKVKNRDGSCPAAGGQPARSIAQYQDLCFAPAWHDVPAVDTTLTFQRPDFASTQQSPASQQVAAGDLKTWTITVPNNGTGVAHNVVITETLGAGWENVTGNAGSTGPAPTKVSDASGTKLVWTVGDVPASTTWTATFRAQVTPNPTDLSTALRLSNGCSNGGCGAPLTHTTYSTPQQDFAKTVSGTKMTVGEPFTYTGTAQLFGVQTYNNVQLVDTLPNVSGTRVFSPTRAAVAHNNLANSWSISSLSGSQITFEPTSDGVLGDATGPEMITVTLEGVWANVAQVQDAGSFTNRLVLSYRDHGQAYNFTANAAAQVVEPSLMVRKSVTPSSGRAGGTAVYTVDLYHPAGNTTTAYNVALSDLLPAGLTYNPGSLMLLSGPSGTLTGTTAPSLSAFFPAIDSSWTSDHPLRLQYSVVVASSAQPGTAFNNTVNATWMSLPNVPAGVRRDGSGGVNDYRATASAQIGINEVGLTKTGPVTVTAGTPINYVLTLHNYGPDMAQGAIVTDTMPFQVAGISTTPAGPTCAASGQNVTCWPGDIAPGADYTINVRGTVAADTPPGATLRNSAVLTVASSDTNPVNNMASTETEVVGAADLVVHKYGPATVTAGSTAQFTMTIKNLGPSQAPDVDLKDYLPGEATFASLVSDAGPCVLGGICQFGNMPVGTSHVVTAVVRIPSDATGTFVNRAQGFSGIVDPVPANNSSSIVSSVTTSADVGITKIALKDPVAPGEGLVYELTVSNAGPSDAQNVKVTDTLPSGVTFVSATTPCVSAGSQVRCSLATLAAGSVSRYQIGTIVNSNVVSGTHLVNTVDLGTTTPGSGLNKHASVSTLVQQSFGPPADVSITKVQTSPASPSPVTTGRSVTYTLSVRNAGPAIATNVEARDLIPAGTSLAAISINNPEDAGAFCTLGGSCYVGTLHSVTTASITVVLRVDPGVANGTTLLNQSQVSADQPDPDPSNNLSSVSTAVTTAGSLSLAKRSLVDPVAPGELLLYELQVTNQGSSSAAGVVVSDTLPPGVTFNTTASPGCAESMTPGTVRCQAGTLAPNAMASFLLGVTVNTSVVSGTVLGNQASAQSTTPNILGASASVGTTVQQNFGPPADLALSKEASAPGVLAGDLLTYTLRVTNHGPAIATDVRLVDALPAGVAVVAISASQGLCDRSVSCQIGTLASGASATVGVTVRVAANQAGALLSNTAQSSADQYDPVPDNDRATVVTTVAGQADLSLTKTATPDTATPGQPLTYRLVVSNAGPSDARNVVLTDTLPADFIAISLVPAQGLCSPAGVCTLGTVAAGASVAILINGTVASSTGAPLANQAVVGSTTADPQAANNQASLTTPLIAAADLSIVKRHTPAVVVAGQDLTYQITVRNHGPQAVSSVTVTDTLPAGLVPGATVPAADSSTPLVWHLGDLAVGAERTITVAVHVPSSLAQGMLVSNSAAVSGNLPDLQPGNNTAADLAQVTALADLGLAKQGAPGTVVAGSLITYSLTITNYGPSDAVQVQTVDALPSEVTLLSVRPSQGLCGGPACILGDMPAGSHAVITLTARVRANVAPGADIYNTALVASYTSDPGPHANMQTIANHVTGQADLQILKSHSGQLVAGQELTYRLTAGNNGPSVAPAVVVTDTLPAGLSYLRASGNCTRVATGPDVVRCTVGTLDVNASAELDVTVLPDSALTGVAVVNTAAVSSGLLDPDPTNNQATDSTVPTSQANLRLSKTAAQDPAAAGTQITYTLTIANDGPSQASGVTITDTLPAGLSYVSGGDDCALAAGRPDLVVCHAPAPLDAGASLALDIVTAVSPAALPGSMLINRASATSPVPDPESGNNQALAFTQVVAGADIVVAKQASKQVIAPGEIVTYQITAHNAGPAQASDVDVKDLLPPALTLQSLQTSQGACAGAICQLGALPVGRTVVMTATVRTDPSLPAEAQVCNSAMAFQDTPDPDPANNTATACIETEPRADVSLTKTAPATSVPAGQTFTYTLVAHNAGPSDAQAVVLSDTLPAEVIYQDATPEPAAGPQPLVWTLGVLPAGESRRITLTVMLNSAASQSFANAASITSSTTDPVPSNNTSSASVTVVTRADLSVTKAAEPLPAQPGRSLIYTLTVANMGPSDAAGVVLTDTLPVELSFVEGTPAPVLNSSPLVWHLGNIPAGQSRIVQATLLVSSQASQAFTNTATVGGTTPDPDPDNNTDSLLAPLQYVDLSISKDDGVVWATAGQSLTYVLTVRNHGNAPASGVIITDVLPVGTTFVGGSDDSVEEGGIVTWPEFTLDAGSAVTRSLTVLVGSSLPNGLTAIENVAGVRDDGTYGDDPTSDDDTASDVDQVPPDLAISKTDGGLTVEPGATIVYTLTYRNVGGVSAVDTVITETVPATTTFHTAASTPGWSCADASPVGTLCTLHVGALEPGAEGQIQFAVNVLSPLPATPGLQIVNTVCIGDNAGNGGDFNPEDNSATDTTPVSIPTSIDPVSLAARYEAGAVAVRWSLLDTRNVVGFHLWRAADGNRANAMRITRQAVPVQQSDGGLYSYPDLAVEIGQRYTYWLQVQLPGGGAVEYGPATVSIAAPNVYEFYLPLVAAH